jgi:hypothetical protein
MHLFALILCVYVGGCGIAMICFLFGRLPLLEKRQWPWPVIFIWPCALVWPLLALGRRAGRIFQK